MKGLLSPPRRPQINSRSQPDARGAWFAGRNSMRAPKARTLDHFLFSPRLRNASGAIIHPNRVPIVFPIFFCFGRNAAIWFYRDYRSQRDCFAHSDGNCTGWSDICLLTIRSIESNKKRSFASLSLCDPLRGARAFDELGFRHYLLHHRLAIRLRFAGR